MFIWSGLNSEQQRVLGSTRFFDVANMFTKGQIKRKKMSLAALLHCTKITVLLWTPLPKKMCVNFTSKWIVYRATGSDWLMELHWEILLEKITIFFTVSIVPLSAEVNFDPIKHLSRRMETVWHHIVLSMERFISYAVIWLLWKRFWALRLMSSTSCLPVFWDTLCRKVKFVCRTKWLVNLLVVEQSR